MQIDVNLIKKFEKMAAAKPSSYRRRVAFVAILADFALMLVTLFPFALVLGLVIIFYQQPVFTWIAIGTFLLFVWFLRPSNRLTGEKLSEKDAPTLFAELKSLQDRLQVPGSMEVLINDKFNASAFESRGWFGVIGVKRVLTLGLPFLALLSREQVIAVIAHEMGHFSRRHGRLGHWLYRARLGWLSYAEDVDEADDVYSRAIGWYANQFLPSFNAMCFVHSRQCEYEADADAASVMGASVAANALVAVHVQSDFFHEALPRFLNEWQAANAAIPTDFYVRISAAAAAWQADARAAALSDALQEKTGYVDTHPCLKDRLGAIAQESHDAKFAGGAGESLLGAAWTPLCEAFSQKWVRDNRTNWAAGHYWHKDVVNSLDASHETTNSTMTQLEEQLLVQVKLVSIAQLPEVHERVTQYQTLLDQFPANYQIQYHTLQSRLSLGDVTAIPPLAKLWDELPWIRMATSSTLARYFADSADTAQAAEWETKRKSARARRGELQERATIMLDEGKFENATLHSSLLQFLQHVLVSEGLVARAWLLHKTLPLLVKRSDTANDVNVYVFWLILDTAACKSAETDEEDIAARYQQLLTRAVGTFSQILVFTSYTTESIPAELEPHTPLFESEQHPLKNVISDATLQYLPPVRR
jgi:Zn-dependent protease with chaperone function